jgi:hypothetical protein
MPAELKQSPGYVPFTLSSEAQAWVDSMAEIQDFQDSKVRRVIGRPKPPAHRPRRQLTGEPPPAYAPPPAPPTFAPPATPPTRSPPRPSEPPREPPRTLPEIVPGRTGAPLPAPARTTVHPAPEVEDSPTSRPARHPRPAPEIGGSGRQEASETHEELRAMPEIGGAPEKTPLEKEADESREKPRPMPEIG